MRASSLSRRTECCKHMPAALTSASAEESRSAKPSKEFRKSHTRTRSSYSGTPMTESMKLSGSSKVSIPSGPKSETASCKRTSSSAQGKFPKSNSTSSGLSTLSSMAMMASSTRPRSGIRASMHQTCRRRCSSNRRRRSARGRSTIDFLSGETGDSVSSLQAVGENAGGGASDAKRASNASVSKAGCPESASSFAHTVPAASGLGSMQMGVQKSLFRGTFGTTSGFRGSAPFDLPFPRPPPFFGGGGAPLPLPLPLGGALPFFEGVAPSSGTATLGAATPSDSRTAAAVTVTSALSPVGCFSAASDLAASCFSTVEVAGSVPDPFCGFFVLPSPVSKPRSWASAGFAVPRSPPS
mmetsp:Transcript_105183/g.279966  ORF Transcript_105183/g.279966 Transcript_105183/m.279966 type:complete len:354 (-) Transcript_105183:1369-2430(-)